MDRFDNRGMLVFPNPDYRESRRDRNIVVIGAAYGPSGQSLINTRVKFGKYAGIMVRVRKKDGSEGMVAISPIFKDRSRISLDIDLTDGEEVELIDPTNSESLPVFDKCECGSDLVAIYTTTEKSLNDSAVICRRVGCQNSEIRNGGEVVSQRLLESEDHYSG